MNTKAFALGSKVAFNLRRAVTLIPRAAGPVLSTAKSGIKDFVAGVKAGNDLHRKLTDGKFFETTAKPEETEVEETKVEVNK